MKNNFLVKAGAIIGLCVFAAFTTYNTAKDYNRLSRADTNEDLMRPMEKMMERMRNLEMTGDIDEDFALMMTEHHQGAIDMSDVLRKSGKDEKLRSMAEKSSEKQRNEQRQLGKFTDDIDNRMMKGDTAKRELLQAMEKAMKEMKSMKMTGDIDEDFASMMISHHKSGVELSEIYQGKGEEEGLLELSRNLVDNQEKEIAELQNWLKDYQKRKKEKQTAAGK